MLRPMALLLLASFPALPANAQPITITTSDCQALLQYVPSPDVNYRPGVDVHGKSVAPADLDSGGGWQPPASITFPLTINPFDPQGTSNSAMSRQFGLTQMAVGTVTVDTRTGNVLLDGKPVAPPAAQAIAEECRKRTGSR